MRRGTMPAVALCVGLLATALAGCGSSDRVAASPTRSSTATAPAVERARLLATCPAEAPSWLDIEPPVGDYPSLAVRQPLLLRAAGVATAYLAGLPADQTGEVRLDHHRQAIVVQVTRDADRVRQELQRRFQDGVGVEVEIIRYSKAELDRAAAAIRALDGLELSTIGTGANGRLDVTVPGDVDAARTRIAAAVDRCMVSVEHGERPVPAAVPNP